MSITSFEVDMQASRNFIDLALSSSYNYPPAIIFVSSIGIFTSTSRIALRSLYSDLFLIRLKRQPSRTAVPEASPDDPESPFGSGLLRLSV